jgi:class I fructose-bisphosphate aldolase
MSNERPALAELGLGAGKQARLHRILFDHGAGNGTAMFLPYDQGLEHGPRDFFANPAASSPRYVIDLALEGGFNGVVLQIGLAEKFYWEYAGEIPLVLKLNGKTEIPSDASALSPLNATVEEAVRLGADAVGYTLYVGTPAQEADFEQYRKVRADAARLGMPLIVWAYPRGSAIEAKGGKDSFYAVDYAARTASELGADVVKLNFPHPEKNLEVPGAYTGDFTSQQAIDAVVRSANRSLVLISGGSKAGDDAMLEKARESMEAGATGLIFGRNVWQREHDESLRFASALRTILEKHPSQSRAR